MNETSNTETAGNSKERNGQTKRLRNTWVYYALFILLMIGVIYVWDDVCNKFFFDDAHGFFRENRMEDIISSVTAVWEELVFRLIPFMITSFAVILVRKPKWLKYLLGVVGAIGIICVQLQFGALHYNPLVDESYVRPMTIQGGAGIILALTYAGIMCYSLNNRLNQSDMKLKSKIKALLVANLLACLGSAIVHAAANLLMVFTQTF